MQVPLWIAASLLCPFVAAAAAISGQASKLLPPAADSDGYVGSKACASCHSDIARKYAATPMANASGAVGPDANQQPKPGSFLQDSTGAEYRIFKGADGLYFEYSKTLSQSKQIGAKTRLDYFVGSESHARGYIFAEDGRLFEAPVAYYSGRDKWDVVPGYEIGKNIFLGREIEEACLTCHASGIELQPDGKNVSVQAPFREGAVSCERCHGPGEAHIKSILAGKGSAGTAIVNPAKLAPEQRDSICAQCHLSGEARINKPGKSDRTFRAGDKLPDHIVPFIWSTPDRTEFKVVGHFDALWQSRCKRTSGDKLWCGTCHDPHTTVAPAQKAAYYREKCFTCHTDASCKAPSAVRLAKQDNCIGCHMPERQVVDGLHTEFTDHSIQRVPGRNVAFEAPQQPVLVPFWSNSANSRDLALAYGEVAWKTHTESDYIRAFHALQAALPNAPADPEVLSELGYLFDLSGSAGEAEKLYERALAADPANIIALSNLAEHVANEGKYAQAEQLWKRAIAQQPGLAIPGIDLAILYLRAGNKAAAQSAIRNVLLFSPDSEKALQVEAEIK